VRSVGGASATGRRADARRRQPPAGVIFHSDRGSEYSAVAFRDRLRALGIPQSLIHGTRFASEATLRRELRRYIHYYNQHRRHSALAYQSPADYESCAA
jgi:transposase InsO family protein